MYVTGDKNYVQVTIIIYVHVQCMYVTVSRSFKQYIIHTCTYIHVYYTQITLYWYMATCTCTYMYIYYTQITLYIGMWLHVRTSYTQITLYAATCIYTYIHVY